MKEKPELLSPAGSFESAIYAFRNGADAVYLGLKEFSARKSAVNFTMEDLSRLKRFAQEKGKRIYVTINTVITEGELPRLAEIAKALDFMEIDGVIIQDLGVLSFLKENFPNLPVHASTQAAVHTAEGVRFLKREGVSRIILSRELSVTEIELLKKAEPDMELEVFIHGALCYSFSGLCFASGVMLNRSANRGDCAGICRTWFEGDGDRKFFFSMKDLAAYRQIEPLIKAGVSSFKIEGRMKSPQYTGLASNLYRDLIDGKISPGMWEELSTPLRTVFSRPYGNNWISGNFRSMVTYPYYPSHMGIEAGTLIESDSKSFTIKLKTDISVRDGLMFFSRGTPAKAVSFGVKRIFTLSGKPVTESKKGDTVTILSPQKAPVSEEVRKISSHNLNWPKINPTSFPLWKKKVDVTVRLTRERIEVSAKSDSVESRVSENITVEEGRVRRDFRKLLQELFRSSGSSKFECSKVTLINETGLGEDSIFVPPKELKSIRREFFEALDSASSPEKDAPLKKLSADRTRGKREQSRGIPRKKLVPKNNAPIPFVLFDSGFSPESLPIVEGKIYMPLMPVLFNSGDYLKRIRETVEARSGSRFVIGLNNPTHLEWVEELSKYQNVSFFIDYGMYLANSRSYRFFTEKIPKLDFCYFWIEGSKEEYEELVSSPGNKDVPVYFIGKDFSPHLFLSRGCYTNNLCGGKCPAGCGRDFNYSLTQGKKKYRVIVKDCMTWLFSFDRF